MLTVSWHGTQEKGAADNIADLAGFEVFQGAILRQADQLALVVTDQGDGVLEWIDGFDEAADEGLHRRERAVNLDGTGFGVGLDK